MKSISSAEGCCILSNEFPGDAAEAARYIPLIMFLFLISGCATPTSPSGGPRDKEGPNIVRTEPETGKTQFQERSITLYFNEFVNRSTLPQALSIAPDLGIKHTLDWGRKSVTIGFNKALPDSTTLIVSLGTGLKDKRGNTMDSPFKIAVSTGPTIDKGELVGKIRSAETGNASKGMKVLLYQKPVDLDEQATYISETDTGGTVSFPYLSPGQYKAFWIDDRNRNRKWDRRQEHAQPFPREFIQLEKDEKDTLGTLYVIQRDTIPPSLKGIGLLSKKRMRLRFSENIQWNPRTSITILDSAGQTYSNAFPLYQPADEPYILLAHSRNSLNPNQSYSLKLSSLKDDAGNKLQHSELTFEGSNQSDTTLQRIIRREDKSGVFRDESVKFLYSRPIERPAIKDSLRVVVGDTAHNPWNHATIKQNKLFVNPDSVWQEGVNYQIQAWNPKNNGFRNIQPTIWYPDDMGGIAFSMKDTSSTHQYQLSVTSKDQEITIDTTFSEQITIPSLPPMRYKAVVYKDRNNNGKWDFGQISPYKKPEKYFIKTEIPVKRKLTSDVEVLFAY